MTATTPSLVPITGRTYPVRRELREMGGQWDAGRQCWYVPTERAEEARGLVEVGAARGNVSRRSAGANGGVAGGSGYRYTDRRGCAHFGASCLCIDYPCCGH